MTDQLNILQHNGYVFCVDGAQVVILGGQSGSILLLLAVP